MHGLLTPISPMPPPMPPLSPWLPSSSIPQSARKQQTFFPPSPKKHVELPPYLAIRQMQIGNLFHVGVFSTDAIPQGTRFGPFTGNVIRLDGLDTTKDNSCVWEVSDEKSVLLSSFIGLLSQLFPEIVFI